MSGGKCSARGGGWTASLFGGSLLAALLLFAWTSLEPSRGVRAESAYIGKMLRDLGLGVQIYLCQPADLGVEEWEVGDFARYAYRCEGPRPDAWDIAPEVTFEVLAKVAPEDRYGVLHGRPEGPAHWLRGGGMASFREVRGDDYRLATPRDLRITRSTPSFHVIDHYFPIEMNLWYEVDPPPITWVDLGTERVRTPAGERECRRLRLITLDDVPGVDVWADPAVRPLGIVRITVGGESLELLEHGRRDAIEVPPMVAHLVSGEAAMTFGCSSCHVDGAGRTLREVPR